MSKRFIDTGFLDQKWIRKLTPERKIFLIYLMLKCDNGGIIDLDIEDVEFWIGKKINKIDFLPENYLIPINDSGKYFMPKFIEWQYKDLSSQKFIVAQARQILEKHNLINSDFTLNLDKSYVKVSKTVPESQEQGIGIGIGIGKKEQKKKFIYSDFYDSEILKSNNNLEYIEIVEALFGKNNLGIPLTVLLKMPTQLNYEQFTRIQFYRRKYTFSIIQILEAMENWGNPKKRTTIYGSFQTFLKNELKIKAL